MGKKLNFAVIGCGRIAGRHVAIINKIGKLQAVCDLEYNRAEQIANTYSAKPYRQIDTLLENEEEIDVVSICTPNGLHAEHTIKALNSGYNVLVEKPMSLSVLDSDKMIKTAEKVDKRLFIVKQNRFNPPVVKVKELIENKSLGKIYCVQLNCFWNRNDKYYVESKWKGTRQMDGGTLFTQFSHFIDLLYWFFGDVNEVKTFTENFHHKDIIEFEDTGVCILKFYSGIIGTINFTINSYKNNMEGSITIFGEKGTVKIGGQYLNELEYQVIENMNEIVLDRGNPPNDYGQYKGSMSNHDKVYQNVVEVLNNNGSITTNGYEGLKTVEIINKIYKSNVLQSHT